MMLVTYDKCCMLDVKRDGAVPQCQNNMQHAMQNSLTFQHPFKFHGIPEAALKISAYFLHLVSTFRVLVPKAFFFRTQGVAPPSFIEAIFLFFKSNIVLSKMHASR